MSYGRLYKLDWGPAIFFFFLAGHKNNLDQNLDYWFAEMSRKTYIYGLLKKSLIFQLCFIREALHNGGLPDYLSII